MNEVEVLWDDLRVVELVCEPAMLILEDVLFLNLLQGKAFIQLLYGLLEVIEPKDDDGDVVKGPRSGRLLEHHLHALCNRLMNGDGTRIELRIPSC